MDMQTDADPPIENCTISLEYYACRKTDAAKRHKDVFGIARWEHKTAHVGSNIEMTNPDYLSVNFCCKLPWKMRGFQKIASGNS